MSAKVSKRTRKMTESEMMESGVRRSDKISSPSQQGLLRIREWLPGIREVLGAGLRAVVWVQGCSLHCSGCMVPETWSTKGGRLIDPAVLARKLLLDDAIQGVTVSGGEPTEQPGPVAHLLALIKDAGKNTWVYSGYTIEELVARNNSDVERLLLSTDVLVDGRYDLKKAGSYRFRGSANQRLIRLTDAIPQSECDGRESSRVQISLDDQGQLVVVGIPPPGFLSQFKNALSARGIVVINRSPWK